jgi:hypothetical protein
VPLSNITLAEDARCEFADGLVLTATPPWVARQEMLQSLSERDREAVALATHAFVVTYEAAALGDPDPEWTGQEPKSIQETKYEHCLLGNLALWLSCPSPVHFRVVIHAPQLDAEPFAQQISWHPPLLCHPKDVAARITAQDIPLATRLHAALLPLGRDGTLWTAVRATWAGLLMNIEAIRFALFWIGLEALFGPEDAREITFRLSQRVAFFLCGKRSEARDLFLLAKKGYAFRSKIVHGRWKEDSDSETRMGEAEDLVRRSLVRILQDAMLTERFAGRVREAFLDDLAF